MPIHARQFEKPKAGENVNESFDVTLDDMPGTGCISVLQGAAIILISRQLLEELVAAQPASWKSEQERQAIIYGGRANLILQAASGKLDQYGCARSEPDDSDYQFLISELLDAGQVSIIDRDTNQRVRHVVATYSGSMAGPLMGRGHISYSFERVQDFAPGSSRILVPFLMLSWWSS